MKAYTYRATWQRIDQYGHDGDLIQHEAIRVYARDIHSGFAKAMRRALKDRLKAWELVSVEFWTTEG